MSLIIFLKIFFSSSLALTGPSNLLMNWSMCLVLSYPLASCFSISLILFSSSVNTLSINSAYTLKNYKPYHKYVMYCTRACASLKYACFSLSSSSFCLFDPLLEKSYRTFWSRIKALSRCWCLVCFSLLISSPQVSAQLATSRYAILKFSPIFEKISCPTRLSMFCKFLSMLFALMCGLLMPV